MVVCQKTWAEIKVIWAERNVPFQFEEFDEAYRIYGMDGSVTYHCEIVKGTQDAVEFAGGYKTRFNKPIDNRNGDGRPMLVATSRPIQCTTYFTSSGDDLVNGMIGGGNEFFYDFSNDDNIITEGVPEGYKRKQIDFKFMDPTWIKEGTIYFHNAIKRSYVDLFVMCPQGYPYYKNDGTLIMSAPQDLAIQHFVNKLFVQGDCPMGDELNTESASEEIPAFYFYRMWITVPTTDTISNGYINLELFRERTVVLE